MPTPTAVRLYKLQNFSGASSSPNGNTNNKAEATTPYTEREYSTCANRLKPPGFAAPTFFQPRLQVDHVLMIPEIKETLGKA